MVVGDYFKVHCPLSQMNPDQEGAEDFYFLFELIGISSND